MNPFIIKELPNNNHCSITRSLEDGKVEYLHEDFTVSLNVSVYESILLARSVLRAFNSADTKTIKDRLDKLLVESDKDIAKELAASILYRFQLIKRRQCLLEIVYNRDNDSELDRDITLNE